MKEQLPIRSQRTDALTPGQVLFRFEAAKADFEAEEDLAVGQPGVLFTDRRKVTGKPKDPLTSAGFVEPISAAVTATLVWLSVRLVNHWLKSKEQGTMIDLRATPPSVSRIAGVPLGSSVIVDSNGKTSRHKAQDGKPEEILPLLQTTFGALVPGGAGGG